jgi:hypothetical protein
MLQESAENKKSIKELQIDFQRDRIDVVKLTGIFKAMKLTESFSEK